MDVLPQQTASSLNDQLAELGFDVNRYPFTKLEHLSVACLLYLITVVYFSPNGKKVHSSSSSTTSTPSSLFTFQNVVIFGHNMALCVFSVLCFVSAVPIFVGILQRGGWNAIICEDELSGNDTWWNWTYLFYLSKYYEFMDTFVLIWKGRKPSFLQKYHHIGAAIGMWIIITGHTHTGFVFVIPNSFIHSIMYFYYALSVWKIKVPFKYILTGMQMFQFGFCALLGFNEWWHWDCLRFADHAAMLFHWIYVPILWVMFALFYRKTYQSKKTKAA